MSYAKVALDDDDEAIPVSSPAQRASFVARLVFAWQTPLFLRGAKTRLVPEDMAAWPLRRQDDCGDAAAKLAAAWADEQRSAGASGEPRLLRALVAAFGRRVALGGCFKLSYMASVFVNVFVIRALLNGLVAGGDDNGGTWWFGLLFLAPLMGLCQFGQSCSQHHLWNTAQVAGISVRSGVTTLLFSKCLRLRDAELRSSSKDAVTLMTTDVERIVQALAMVHWFWASIAEILICLALSTREIGWSALAGLAVMVVCTPLQGRLGKAIADVRRTVVAATDARVRMMNEVLSGYDATLSSAD